MESFLILPTTFLILVCIHLSILVCSSAVGFPTTIFIVNKYHFYNTTAAISELSIHNAMGPVLEPSLSEREGKTHDSKLREVDMKLKLSKCFFLKKHLLYFRHLILGGGIYSIKHKVASLLNLEPSTDVTETRHKNIL